MTKGLKAEIISLGSTEYYFAKSLVFGDGPITDEEYRISQSNKTIMLL